MDTDTSRECTDATVRHEPGVDTWLDLTEARDKACIPRRSRVLWFAVGGVSQPSGHDDARGYGGAVPRHHDDGEPSGDGGDAVLQGDALRDDGDDAEPQQRDDDASARRHGDDDVPASSRSGPYVRCAIGHDDRAGC